ncbi:MAG: DUF2339 domain-containing protein, partial [Mycobacteriaceae bacterium]
MTQQTGSPDAITRLTQEVVTLSGRLQQVGRELQAVQSTQTPRAASQQQPFSARPASTPSPRSPWGPVPPPRPAQPAQPPWPPQQAPLPALPRHPAAGTTALPASASRWWQREGVTSRVLAIAGSVITLLGVVMFLVLAVQNGYLGPVPRVIGGAVLSGALIGAAFALRNRQGGAVGAVALAGTGTAGLYLAVVAATAYYQWLPDWAGLLLGFGIATVGLVIAHRWNSETLAVLAVLGAAALSPVLTGWPDATLTSFLLVLSVAGGVLQLRHRWQVLFVVRSVVPVISALLSLTTVDTTSASSVWLTVLTCVLVTVVGLGFALHALHQQPSDRVALAMMSLSVAPTLLTAAVLDRWPGSAVIAGLALALLTLRFAMRWLPRGAQVVLTIAAAVAAYEVISIAGTVDSRASLLLAGAIGLTVIAHRMRSKLALGLALVYGALGALVLLVQAPPAAAMSSSFAQAHASWPAVVSCLLLVGAAVLLAYEVQWSGTVGNAPVGWVVGGIAALYGITTALVSAAVLLPVSDGFVAGHTVATVTWMVAALVLLG